MSCCKDTHNTHFLSHVEATCKEKMNMSVNGGVFGGWEPMGGRKRMTGKEYNQSTLYIYMYEQVTMKPILKIARKIRGGWGDGKK
jgi:hypothetical protein